MTKPPIVEAKDIKKSFANNHVIKGISLAANKGEVISILGASGSGKSTFLRCINLLERPTEGYLWFSGEELKLVKDKQNNQIAADEKQLSRIRAKVAMVFQNFNLWPHLTILENVYYSPHYVLKKKKAQAIEEAKSYLQKVGLYEKQDAYPAFLSGGQQQRAAIARALAMSPDLMLFDEPTSALDPELVGEVLKVIRLLAEEGCTMLLVTHEMAFARDVSSRIVFLHNGTIEEEGEPQHVFNNPTSPRFQQFLARMK